LLSQWKPPNAAENFDMYRFLQPHRAVLPAIAWHLVRSGSDPISLLEMPWLLFRFCSLKLDFIHFSFFSTVSALVANKRLYSFLGIVAYFIHIFQNSSLRGDSLPKSLKLCRFKSDLDEIWQKRSWSKCASTDRVRLLIRRHTFKSAAITSFGWRQEDATAHATASIRRSLLQRPWSACWAAERRVHRLSTVKKL